MFATTLGTLNTLGTLDTFNLKSESWRNHKII